jgi:hypothetical protein
MKAALAVKTGSVALPTGEEVRIRELTIAERGEFVERVRTTPKTLGSWLVGVGCIDKDGNRLLSDEDSSALEAGSPAVIDAIGSAVLKLSGLGAKDDDASGEA